MTQNSSQIQHEELLKACRELTPTQRDVLDDGIHLFDHPNLAKLALAQATCLEFGMTATVEEA